METGPQFTVVSERLEKRRIEPATFALQDQHANHCATTAPKSGRLHFVKVFTTETLGNGLLLCVCVCVFFFLFFFLDNGTIVDRFT